ncbi:HNH endonuclease signature motif containing protein [Candidatus Accumulibacter sp. ACC005]|uniref:HNH endonuclease signature motif containing protein n=1 Tax=Candidatus Accumulibacter sp. ACC005 TaxID=2823331 RepID=UPI0025BC4D88|nr:HNH endonuclease signature motif containing protein [Candidatus Accumulibacter sp. ACC005]
MTCQDKDGYLRGPLFKLVHVAVAERALGKRLPAGAVVHHVDGNRKNNAPENLLVCPDASYHRLIHARATALNDGGNAAWRKCIYCHQYDAPDNMSFVKRRRWHYHKPCAAAYQRNRKKQPNQGEFT